MFPSCIIYIFLEAAIRTRHVPDILTDWKTLQVFVSRMILLDVPLYSQVRDLFIIFHFYYSGFLLCARFLLLIFKFFTWPKSAWICADLNFFSFFLHFIGPSNYHPVAWSRRIISSWHFERSHHSEHRLPHRKSFPPPFTPFTATSFFSAYNVFPLLRE